MSKQNLSPLPPIDSAQRYSIEEAIRYLRISRFTIYERIATGKIATIKEGRRRFCPGSAQGAAVALGMVRLVWAARRVCAAVHVRPAQG
jgi:excisionase family DNA binding protein